MQASWIRRLACGTVCLTALTVQAVDVSVAFVTSEANKSQPVDTQQFVYESPFGGWVAVTWPFGLKVDDEDIMGFMTGRDKMLELNKRDAMDVDQKAIQGMLEKLDGSAAVKLPNEGRLFELDRASVVVVNLARRQHEIYPLGIIFTVGEDGSLSCDDPRARVKDKTRLEVICHPVSIRTTVGPMTVADAPAVSFDGRNLFGALNTVIGEFEADRTKKKALLYPMSKLTAYLPMSRPDKPYVVNGVRFEVAADGRVTLIDGATERVTCLDAREIRFTEPAQPAVVTTWVTRQVGVRWQGMAPKTVIAGGNTSITCDEAVGTGYLSLPGMGGQRIGFGELGANLPAADRAWPHALLIGDGAAKTIWLVETPALTFRPGEAFRCRVKRLAGTAPDLAGELRVSLDALAGDGVGGALTLTGAAGGVFAGDLPAKPGLWRVRADGDSPLRGQTLGLALIADQANDVVSMFTVHNRGLYRRGDSFDLLWVARAKAEGKPEAKDAATWPVRLRGMGLDVAIGRIVASDARSGQLRVDTSALAPGDYTVAVDAVGVAGYPFRFRVCQRELLSDFELYSFFPVMRATKPYPGSPVTAYHGTMPDGPGLIPYLNDGDGSMDRSLAAYANASLGPSMEMFDQPGMEERSFMALAAMGMRGVPSYPSLMHAETENPKHSSPEDLAEMRRRMALHMQQHADYPGLDGYWLGWYARRSGHWENSPAIDGHQGRRNALMHHIAGTRISEAMTSYKDMKLTELQRGSLFRWMNYRYHSSTLPDAFGEWFVDARKIRPELTLHNAHPTFWLGGWESWSPAAYATLTHRNSLDYTDYCIPPWGNFRAPAFLAMGNQKKQKIQSAHFTHSWRSEMVATAFGAAGRGADGLAMDYADLDSQNEGLLRIFSRFGSWFTALDPLPDVAVYFNDNPNRASVVLHDLARMRRPGMLVSPEDVLAGELSKYQVLVLAGLDAFELLEIDKAVRDFEARGGLIIKDDACHADLPGRKLGFAYDGSHVHGGWGLGGPNGEWEFASLWENYRGIREKFLIEAFAKAPTIPVTTPDTGVIISPLGSKEAIICFVINKTEVPMEMTGRWRQAHVLPRIGELQVEKGWYIHDLLKGRAAPVQKSAQGQRVAIDLTRFDGALYLLTKREPKGMGIRTERTSQTTVRLTGWLADGKDTPLADPMPFEVTLTGPDGGVFFRKMAALGPDYPLDVPVPALPPGTSLELRVRDLVIGCSAMETVSPATTDVLAVRATPDYVGGIAPIKAFLADRKGPVTVLLDEGQEGYLPAAERLAALFKKTGRTARVVIWDPTDVRPLPLRWVPLREDVRTFDLLRDNGGFAWRIKLSPWAAVDSPLGFNDPLAGCDEYGPRLRHDADVVMMGTPANHRALADLAPFLRRTPTDNYPAAGGFFIHYLWSPLLGGYDGLYLGCKDVAGAEAAVACLAEVVKADSALPSKLAAMPAAKPVETRGGAPEPVINLFDGVFGTQILDFVFSPSGKRIFLTTASYGDWFYVLSPTGDILEKRMPPIAEWIPNWWNWGRSGLRPVSDTALHIGMWNGEHLYDLDKGFVGRSPGEPPHHLPGPGNGGGPIVRASTRMRDDASGITYLGGNDHVHALDAQWRLLWRFDDAKTTADLVYPRGLFPRAVSGDGRVLLLAGFGVHKMLYASAARNPSIMGIDIATGKLLWERRNVMLNEGKVVPLDDRFLVIDDNNDTYEILSANGRDGDYSRGLSGVPAWLVKLPLNDSILAVVQTFDRAGKTSRALIRPMKGGEDRVLPIEGRVGNVTLGPQSSTIAIMTTSGRFYYFTTTGDLLWQIEIPGGAFMKFSPDAKTVVVGTHVGTVYFVNVADGKQLRMLDLNDDNNITPERFANQVRMGEVPQDAARAIPPLPPEPSYLTLFSPKKVTFGPNQAPPEKMRALLKPAEVAANDPATPATVGKLTAPISLTFKAEAGALYLVEMLNAVANPADYKPTLRLEVAVKGKPLLDPKNLPYTVRLPLGTYLTRRRAAFRADVDGDVTLTLRGVLPNTAKKLGKGESPYDDPLVSEAPLLLGDVVVAAIRFPGPNLLFDGGPGSGSQPAGALVLTSYPWENGANNAKIPYTHPSVSLRLVNGLVANQESAWDGAGGVDYTDIRGTFDKPKSLSVVAIFEDPSPPQVSGNGVSERVTSRYALNLGSKSFRVYDNTQLFQMFECPSEKISSFYYLWAGKFEAQRGLTDGAVRTMQIEAYAEDDIESTLINQLKKAENDTLELPDL